MKRFFIAIVAALAFMSAAAAPEDGFDYRKATEKNHPRLFIDKADFARLKKNIRTQDSDYLLDLHTSMMTAAEAVFSEKALEYKKDASGRRILEVSRKALRRISACSYAYRFTNDKKYLKQAENDLLTVCSFDNWNPSHYLDVAEMSLAVAIGYDWLYSSLKESTRRLIEKTILDYAFKTAAEPKEQAFYTRTNNWNQVCNAGLISAAIAIYESCPETAAAIIDKSIKSNRLCLADTYAPDGAYPEGAGYWGYGNDFQVILLSDLEYAFGTDFGLSEAPGFLKTGNYEFHAEGNQNKFFNYSDSGLAAKAIPALFYFAWKTHNNELLYREIGKIEKGWYTKNRVLFIALMYASRIGDIDIKEPETKLFAAKGENPVVFARSGYGLKDTFLGLKAGTAKANHAHMDAGSFVYEAYGYMWAKDYTHPSYSNLEVDLKPFNQGLFNRRQDALRWQIFGYNNRQHNTLTVNGRDHNVLGAATLEDICDNDSKRGASINFNDVFFDDLLSARRDAYIVDGNILEVCDHITTRQDKPAHIRWTMLTDAYVKVAKDCIYLTHGDVTLKLKANGADVKYTRWSTDPSSYTENPTRNFTAPAVKGTSLIGFEYDVPADSSVTVTATLER